MTDTSATEILPPYRANAVALVFGIATAPAFWIAQLVASYTASDLLCYRGDHPAFAPPAAALGSALVVFDVIALAGALAGGIVSFLCWRALSKQGSAHTEPRAGRSRFMAIWGLFSSLWFFVAIAFGSIGPAVVPLCLR